MLPVAPQIASPPWPVPHLMRDRNPDAALILFGNCFKDPEGFKNPRGLARAAKILNLGPSSTSHQTKKQEL